MNGLAVIFVLSGKDNYLRGRIIQIQ